MKRNPTSAFLNRGGLSIASQLIAIRKERPELEASFNKNELIVKGKLQPASSMRSYQFLLRYRLGISPKIWIKNPVLIDLAESRKIPHLYKQNPAQLCLFYPQANQWTRHMLLTKSFLVWASEWLYHFEIWLVTDEWTGGGILHE